MTADLTVTQPTVRARRMWRLPPPFLLVPAFAVSAVMAGCIAVLVVYSLYSFQGGAIQTSIGLATWRETLGQPLYRSVLLRSLELAGRVAIFSLVIGYPTALALWRGVRRRAFAVAVVIIASPLVISLVVRAYGWLLLLGSQGLVNDLIVNTHLRHQPLQLLYNETGVVISLVQGYMPLMVFPIWSSLRQIDAKQLEAASDLGATALQRFWRIIVPLSLPGIITGCQLVFMLTLSTVRHARFARRRPCPNGSRTRLPGRFDTRLAA